MLKKRRWNLPLARIIREKWNNDRFLIDARFDCDEDRIWFDRVIDFKGVSRVETPVLAPSNMPRGSARPSTVWGCKKWETDPL
jgi:hypothetical protein